MIALSPLYILSILALSRVALASLYVIQPVSSTTCTGGKSCTVSWLDDGTQPLLGSIGVCTVSLFASSGDTQHLVQQITPVDVSAAHSLTFTPDPNAGSNSSEYYIQFESTTLKNTTSSSNSSFYAAFSASFTLSGMFGSFSSPVASDTSSIAIPTSVSIEATSSDSVTSTRSTGATSSTSSISRSSSSSIQSSPSSSVTTPASSTSSHSSSVSTGSTTLTSPASTGTSTSSATSAGSTSSTSGSTPNTPLRFFSLPFAFLFSSLPLFL